MKASSEPNFDSVIRKLSPTQSEILRFIVFNNGAYASSISSSLKIERDDVVYRCRDLASQGTIEIEALTDYHYMPSAAFVDYAGDKIEGILKQLARKSLSKARLSRAPPSVPKLDEERRGGQQPTDMRSSPEGRNESIQKHVVILVHGIRDFALWQQTIGTALSANGFQVYPTNYGRFDLFRFLIPIHYFRRKAVEEILNQIRIVKQQNEHQDISIIAHSFGTYVIAYILRKSFDLRFKRIVFCGSIVKYGFPFEQFSQRFDAPILNEVGSRDIWPAIAESVTWGYGSAGTYGFRRPLVRDRWHNKAGHGYFLNEDFCKKYWIPFLETGETIPNDPTPERPHAWIQLLSIFRVKYIILLLAACLAYYQLQSVRPTPHALPGAVEGSGPIFQPPRMAGRTIDGCIHSPEFSEATGVQCMFPAQKQIADAFCKAAGWDYAGDDLETNSTGKFQFSLKFHQEIGSDRRLIGHWIPNNTGDFIFTRIICRE